MFFPVRALEIGSLDDEAVVSRRMNGLEEALFGMTKLPPQNF